MTNVNNVGFSSSLAAYKLQKKKNQSLRRPVVDDIKCGDTHSSYGEGRASNNSSKSEGSTSSNNNRTKQAMSSTSLNKYKYSKKSLKKQ